MSHSTLCLLMDAGLEGAELLRVVASIEADNQPKPRSGNATRQARYREKKRLSGVTDNATSNVTLSVTEVTPLARVEDNLQTRKVTGQRKKQTREQDLADFVSVLSAFLDADRVQALVDVRSKKGGKLNGHAATLLKAKIETCGLSAADAADTMALRNWISIEASWLESRRVQSHSPPTGNDPFAAVSRIFKAKGLTDNESGSPHRSGQDAQRLSAGQGDEHRGAVVDLRRGPDGDFRPGDH